MKIIIKGFKIEKVEKVNVSTYPTNLYRDDEVKSLISIFIKDSQKKYLQKALESEKLLGPSAVYTK